MYEPAKSTYFRNSIPNKSYCVVKNKRKRNSEKVFIMADNVPSSSTVIIINFDFVRPFVSAPNTHEQNRNSRNFSCLYNNDVVIPIGKNYSGDNNFNNINNDSALLTPFSRRSSYKYESNGINIGRRKTFTILRILSAYLLYCFFYFIRTDARCEKCWRENFEEYKQLRREQILNELLTKLDLKWKPNVTIDYESLPPIGRDNPRVKALFDATVRDAGHRRVRKSTSGLTDYDEMNFIEDDEYAAKNIYPQFYEPEERAPPSDLNYIVSTSPPSWFNTNGKTAFFTILPTISKNVVKKATLTVFVRRPPNLENELNVPLRISVFERYINGTLGDKLTERSFVSNWDKSINEFQLRLDENDVREWLKPAAYRQRIDKTIPMGKDSAFVGLYVQAVHDNANYVIYPDEDKHSMSLELEMQRTKSGRRRRSTRQAVCKPGTNETSCCLYNLTIDFEKVGWDFIIAPKRYNAFICSGDCNETPIDSSNKHGIVTQKHKDTLRCCHPKEYGSITVVYITDNRLIWVREVPDMVAKRCGCA